MNKKILSIFALIMAISILGVSCAKDNSTTNPTTGGSTAPITLDQAKKIIGATSAITANTASFDLSAVKDNVKLSGANFTLAVSSADADKTVKYQEFLTQIKTLKTAMDGAESGLITVNADGIDLDMTDGGKTAKATIPYALQSDPKKTGNFVITFTLTDDGSTFAYDEITKANITGKFTALGVVDSAGTQDAANNDNVTFASADIASGVMALTAKDKTNSGDNEIDLALITQVVAKINGITGLTGAKVTAEPPAANPTASTAAVITVTITLDKGYKFDTAATTAGVTVKDGVGTFTVKITPESTKTWAAAA